MNEVLGSLNLQEYALQSELYGLTPKSEQTQYVKRTDLTTYAKTMMLVGYVACTQLENMGYVTKVELEAAHNELVIPD